MFLIILSLIGLRVLHESGSDHGISREEGLLESSRRDGSFLSWKSLGLSVMTACNVPSGKQEEPMLG